MSFKDYMATRHQQFEDLSKNLNEESKGEFSNDDPRMWYPAADKVGNGSAVIRFLPARTDAKYPLPQAKTWNHGFEGPSGQWYIDKCRTTLGKNEPCPVCEANSKLWNTEKEANRKLASSRKRKLYYYSNVYIMKDQANPENEGQVRIFRYGKKIFEMLNDKMNPAFADMQKVNPFDLIEGATFRLRFKKDESSGFRTYALSTFDEPTPLFDDESKMEEVYDSIYDLYEFVDPATFTSYEAQKVRFEKVIGNVKPKEAFAKKQVEEEVETNSDVAPWDDDSNDVLDELNNVESQDFDSFFEDLKD